MRTFLRWLGQFWPMLLPIVVLIGFVITGTSVNGGRVFCQTPEIDLGLPSEKAIPGEKLVRPVAADDEVFRFRYAATGTEGRAGIPYWIFRAMPRIFADKLKDRGYEAFGFTDDDQTYYTRRAGDSSDGKFKMPRGTVLVDTDLHIPLFPVRFNLKRVALNCSACHRGEYQYAGKRHLVDGMPNGVADLQAFKRFFQWAADDERFTTARVLEEIDELLAEEGAEALTRRERTVYEGIVRFMKKGAAENSGKWMDLRPVNGPGRIDPFNAVKYEVIGAPDDGSAATLDFPSLWNQRDAVRPWHHYDGNTRDSEARNYGSVVGVGGMAITIHKKSIDKVGAWLDHQLAPPAWPFGEVKGGGDAARGKAAFEKKCAGCHGMYDPAARSVEKRPGFMEIHDMETDEERLRGFTPATAQALNKFGDRRQLWSPTAFRPAGKGYLSGPLDGIWARAPYLHNGSVPTLDDLLRDPATRPRDFCRGNPAYDPSKVGFVSALDARGGCAAPQQRHDTTQPGNHNSGHRVLPASDTERADLIAYLRTL
jgi:cytochrome c2